jgi:hypothetical protein
MVLHTAAPGQVFTSFPLAVKVQSGPVVLNDSRETSSCRLCSRSALRAPLLPLSIIQCDMLLLYTICLLRTTRMNQLAVLRTTSILDTARSTTATDDFGLPVGGTGETRRAVYSLPRPPSKWRGYPAHTFRTRSSGHASVQSVPPGLDMIISVGMVFASTVRRIGTPLPGRLS